MTDNLRDRIAKVLWQQRATNPTTPIDWFLDDADAVIRELKMKQEHEMIKDGPLMPNGMQRHKLRHRYVTEWEADE